MTTAQNDASAAGSNGATEPAQTLSQCMLSQYQFCAAGLGLGTAYTLKYKRGYAPMVAAGILGTGADFLYGYIVACANIRERELQ